MHKTWQASLSLYDQQSWPKEPYIKLTTLSVQILLLSVCFFFFTLVFMLLYILTGQAWSSWDQQYLSREIALANFTSNLVVSTQAKSRLEMAPSTHLPVKSRYIGIVSLLKRCLLPGVSARLSREPPILKGSAAGEVGPITTRETTRQAARSSEISKRRSQDVSCSAYGEVVGHLTKFHTLEGVKMC